MLLWFIKRIFGQKDKSMGSYLRNHDVTFEPITVWPGTPTKFHQNSRFKAKLSDTLDKLDLELFRLKAKNVVIQVYLDRSRIRNDGMMRADARPVDPGVIVSFQSIHGHLMYPCDTYFDWTDNLRAIALALEALRAVDRYGVTKRAEQYRGWQQLPNPSGPTIATKVEALEFLRRILEWDAVKILSEISGNLDGVIRQAQVKTHPDKGGNAKDFNLVMECERILKQGR